MADFRLPPFPRGWYLIGLSDEIEAGMVHPLRCFDRDIVLYRGESGIIHVFDAFCPHLGAHLGHGGVVHGDSLRCPFHGWRFGSTGECIEIPYSDRIPAKARLGRWPAHEASGLVLVYYDEAGAPPAFEPAVPPAGDGEWTPARVLRWEVRAHVQDLVEGGVDTPHLQFVHQASGVDPCEIEVAGAELRCHTRACFGPQGMSTDAYMVCRGLGYVATHLVNPSMEARSVLLPTPVSANTVDVRVLLSVRAHPNPRATAAIEEAFASGFIEDFESDRRIWEHKTYQRHPVLCPGDGPIAAFRRWAGQFYPSERA
ncbi:MAG TPA: Rieske 2Fe-2S domain-containing protein [Thermoanaerobaculia bacterium]